MTKIEREDLLAQAIQSEELRINHIREFLNDFPLDSEVNKTVALELVTSIASIEKNIEVLKRKKELKISFTKPFEWDYPEQH